MTNLEVRRESRLRKRARRLGYVIKKSRRSFSIDNLGDYMLLEAEGNFVVIGSHFDATLEDIEEYLGD